MSKGGGMSQSRDIRYILLQEGIPEVDQGWLLNDLVTNVLIGKPLKIQHLMNTEKIYVKQWKWNQPNSARLCKCIVLHSETNTFNCRNKTKTHFWLRGGFKHALIQYRSEKKCSVLHLFVLYTQWCIDSQIISVPNIVITFRHRGCCWRMVVWLILPSPPTPPPCQTSLLDFLHRWATIHSRIPFRIHGVHPGLLFMVYFSNNINVNNYLNWII